MQEIFAALLLPAITALGISMALGAVCPAFHGVSAKVLMGIFVLVLLMGSWDLIVGIVVTAGLWITRIALAALVIFLIIRFVRWVSQRV